MDNDLLQLEAKRTYTDIQRDESKESMKRQANELLEERSEHIKNYHSYPRNHWTPDSHNKWPTDCKTRAFIVVLCWKRKDCILHCLPRDILLHVIFPLALRVLFRDEEHEQFCDRHQES